MNQKNSQLLTLIKLREGHLSDAEGLSVREQLASDALLLQRWKILSQVYEQQMSLDDSLDNTVIDAESVASFVEENMSSEQHAEFERECWDQTTLVREVISAYQAVHLDVSSIRIPSEYAQHSEQASKRIHAIAREHSHQTDVTESTGNYLEKIEDRHRPDRIHSNHQLARETKIKIKRRLLFPLIAAVVAIVVILPTYFVLVHNARNISITKKQPPEPAPVFQENSNLETEPPLKVEMVPELAVVPKSKPAINTLPDSPVTVPKTPAMQKGLNEQPVVAKKALLKESNTPVKLSIDWTKLAGIIGFRTDGSSPWSGILADGFALKADNVMNFELHTLPFSWLQGTLDSGVELVLDADSVVQLSIQGINQKGKTQPADTESTLRQTVIELQLGAGKIAFAKLQAGDILRLHQQRQEWLVEVKQNGTSVGFLQQDESRRELVAFAGEVQITVPLSEQKVLLKADQVIVIKDQTVSLPLKLTGKQNWRSVPSERLKLSQSLIERVNGSKNLLAALMTVPAGEAGSEVLVSTNLGFTLDPAVAVPRATSSRSEIQRTAAIEWLLAAKDDSTTRAVWNQIKVIENTSPSSVSIQNWFQMAQRKVPVNQQLIRELTLGLPAKQPLFVRQCSIHFLRQITRQRFPEYDPNLPLPAAVNSVRLKIRRATGNSGRPAGNTKQRSKK